MVQRQARLKPTAKVPSWLPQHAQPQVGRMQLLVWVLGPVLQPRLPQLVLQAGSGGRSKHQDCQHQRQQREQSQQPQRWQVHSPQHQQEGSWECHHCQALPHQHPSVPLLNTTTSSNSSNSSMQPATPS